MAKIRDIDTAAHRYRAGDKRAFSEIYAACESYIERKAKGYVRTWGCDLEDLIQEGNMGLLRALEVWEPERGAPFAAYASIRITGAIKNYNRSERRRAARTVYSKPTTSQGHNYSTPDGVAYSRYDLAGAELAVPAMLATLTDERDRAILAGIVDGKDHAAIGADIGISKQAVSLRVIAIKERLVK